MARRLIGGLALATALLTFAAVPATAAPARHTPVAPRSFTIGMGYIPSVQFAPFYVAAQRGYYRKAGLNVTFNYALSYNLLELVGAGKVDAANADGTDAIAAIAKAVPIVYVMAEYQSFPVTIFALAKQKIHAVADLRGKTIGVPGRYGANYVGLLAALRAAGLSEKDVHIASIGYTQAQSVAAGKVDAAVGYSTNEPVLLQRHGYAITTIQIGSVANLVAPGVVVGKSLIARDPALLRAFVGATLRGLADTIADPKAAFAICRTQHGLTTLHGSDADDQYAVLLRAISLWHGPLTRAHGLGYSDPKQWADSVGILRAIGQIATTPKPQALYSNAYVTGSAKV